MNSLNSALLEGSLTEEPILSYTPDGLAVCTFTIASHRRVKKDGAYHEEIFHFNIVTHAHLATFCHEYLKQDRGVRVVGRLSQDTAKQVFLEAEHVELKPEPAAEEIKK